MTSVGIVGATGYTGLELMRLLSLHPEVEVSVVTSNAETGNKVTDIFPSLQHYRELSFVAHDAAELKQCQLVFFATPHAAAMHQVPELLDSGCRVIDLSADFRIKDAASWERWYGVQHTAAELLDKAVYGLTELNREAIEQASLVANPGCYPTAISLALLPLLDKAVIGLDDIIADAKSGVSGAGRKAALGGLHTEVSESFKAYSIAGHRHLPEILQTLTAVAGKEVKLTFVPHLVPMNRGILATVYVTPTVTDTEWQALFESYYQHEPFVDVLAAGSHPATRDVRGTNNCQLAVHDSLPNSDRLVIVAAIDNLVKGAAGQAIQNMNLMFDFDERLGLLASGLVP